MGIVGTVEPPVGSSVMATTITEPASIGMLSVTNARPSLGTVNVGPGIGACPLGMNQTSYDLPAGVAGRPSIINIACRDFSSYMNVARAVCAAGVPANTIFFASGEFKKASASV